MIAACPCRVTPALLLLLATLAPQRSDAAERKSLNDLSGPWQLFVDDYLISTKEHVSRIYHPFEKHADNPIITPDKPWEGLVYLYGTVLPAEDGRGYRMWYQTLAAPPAATTVLYATSEDGIHWHKPNLGIRSHQNSKANNMFLPRAHANGIASVIHTPWDPDPQRHYRIMNYDKGGFWAAYSPDGIHVADAPNNPVFTKGGDVGQFLWDPHTNQYVGYVKNIVWVSGMRRRAVARITTDDIESWPDPELVLAPDSFDDRWAAGIHRTHFYGLSAFAYESIYLGFLWIFRATDEQGYFNGPVFAELVSSRDGVHWHRQEGQRTPLLDIGPAGSWDGGQLYTATQPLLFGNTLRLYYGAADKEHGTPIKKMTCSIGLAQLRKDGFASLEAREDTGHILTKPLGGATGQLHLNYCAKDGTVSAEVLDAGGSIIPGYDRSNCVPLQGDSIDQVLRWNGRNDLPDTAAPIRLRFLLKNASLYAFRADAPLRILPEPSQIEPAVLYTFENDRGKTATDVIKADGLQKAHARGTVRIDRTPGSAAFGDYSILFEDTFCPLNTLEINGTRDLGTHFTLAVAAKSVNHRHARLFSSYDDTAAVRTSELVFDCDPSGTIISGLRLICKGISAESNPTTFADDQYHHLAVTYDDGTIVFYLDGTDVGHATIPGGDPVVMERNLFVAEDAGHGRREQFAGRMDDVLVLGRVLSPSEMKDLSHIGADRFFALQQ